MSKIAITGSSGLIGSNLSKKLVSLGHDVVGISTTTGCDLTNEKQTDAVFERVRPDVVYALAAEAAESRGQNSPVYMTQNNSGIFVNTLKASINAGVKRFIYTSSVAVYGEANVPYKEDGPTIPKDIYGVNKLACEQMLQIMSKVHAFNYVIFRPHNIYGPGQNMRDPYKNVVALFMRKLIEGEPYKLFGFGKMRRAFSYVDDVVGVMVDSLRPEYNNKTLNVGSEKDISIKELSDLIQNITGLTGEIEMLKGRPQEISMFLADHTRQRELTRYNETPIEDGLMKTWEWVRSKKLQPIIQKETEICLKKE
jgi:UDP-glucose 4-epimerase